MSCGFGRAGCGVAHPAAELSPPPKGGFGVIYMRASRPRRWPSSSDRKRSSGHRMNHLWMRGTPRQNPGPSHPRALSLTATSHRAVCDIRTRTLWACHSLRLPRSTGLPAGWRVVVSRFSWDGGLSVGMSLVFHRARVRTSEATEVGNRNKVPVDLRRAIGTVSRRLHHSRRPQDQIIRRLTAAQPETLTQDSSRARNAELLLKEMRRADAMMQPWPQES